MKTFNEKTFILDMASDIQLLSHLLYKYFPQPVLGGLEQINNLLRQNKALTYNHLPLEFYFSENPRHMSHTNVKNLRLFLNLSVAGDHTKIPRLENPFAIKFEFNICIYGDNENGAKLIYALHFDKHIQGQKDHPSEEVHPIYHFQFGGRNLKNKCSDFGQALFFDSPRIMHHPMEIILGLDFVLSNFFPKEWNMIRKEGVYMNIIKKYQMFFIYPYFKKICDYFENNENNLKWDKIDIYPQLIPRR